MNRVLEWLKTARLKDWLKLIKKLLPHAAIIISGMLLTFFAIDRVNKPMGFMTNEFHKVLTSILAVLCVYFSIQIIAIQRRDERSEYRRAMAKRRQSAPARSVDDAPRPYAPSRPYAAPDRPRSAAPRRTASDMTRSTPRPRTRY